jgi:hypothetical protein
MKVVFLAEAQQELLEVVDYYESARRGLGARFNEELSRSVSVVLSNPAFGQIRVGGYRRINLKVFPYYLPYIGRGDILWVLAVAHGHRLPNYWIDRRNQIP